MCVVFAEGLTNFTLMWLSFAVLLGIFVFKWSSCTYYQHDNSNNNKLQSPIRYTIYCARFEAYYANWYVTVIPVEKLEIKRVNYLRSHRCKADFTTVTMQMNRGPTESITSPNLCLTYRGQSWASFFGFLQCHHFVWRRTKTFLLGGLWF